MECNSKTTGWTSQIKLRFTADGLHLEDSILWFDSHSSGQLSFLSSPISKPKMKVPQIITTEETAKLLSFSRGITNTLVCQYNRPFSIGKLRMELLPSGSILGGASLYVETENGRLLYAPLLQSHKISTVRRMQLKRATTLILGANHPSPEKRFPNRKKEIEKFMALMRKLIAEGSRPVVLCSSLGTAQELTQILCKEEVGALVHPIISRINRVYEDFGSPLSVRTGLRQGSCLSFSTYSSRRARDRTRPVLWPLRSGKSRLCPDLPDGPIVLIKDANSHSDFDGVDRLAGSFVISMSSDGRDYREIVAATQPRELFFVGPYAKSYADEFRGLCPRSEALYADGQPTLF